MGSSLYAPSAGKTIPASLLLVAGHRLCAAPRINAREIGIRMRIRSLLEFFLFKRERIVLEFVRPSPANSN